MGEIDSWLDRYGQSLEALQNPVVYWVALPMLILGTVGALWALPVPAQFEEISPLLNWGSAFLMATTIYYFIISLSLAIGLLPFLLGVAAVHTWLAGSPYPPGGVSVAALVAGTAGLCLGGRRPGRPAHDDRPGLGAVPALSSFRYSVLNNA